MILRKFSQLQKSVRCGIISYEAYCPKINKKEKKDRV